jgi:hypothetical protein
MAATGYTPILIYASGTASNVPLAANLTSDATKGAELALNYADGKLYFKNSSGVVTLLAGAGGTGIVAGSNTQIQFNNSGVFGASASLTWDGTYLTAGSIKNSALTNTRVTFAGASGLLSDSANLTWSGTALNVTGTVAVTGALTATLDSTFSSTGALQISKGTTGQQPGSPATGMMRYNTTTNQFEGYSGSSPAWKSIGGSALSNDTSTASNLYPVFAGATSGTAENLYTGNAYLLYKPSTGEFQARAPVASNGIVVNSLTVATSYTIAAGFSGASAGPITIASGAVVTVAGGSRWVIS